MKFIEPVLFPVNPDLLVTLKLIDKHNLNDINIVLNYNFQIHDLTILQNYIDPQLCKKFAKLLDKFDNNEFPFTKTVLTAVDSPYEKYYLYFIQRFMLDEGWSDSITDFKKWLRKKKSFAFKKFKRLDFNFYINGYYNSIVIPSLWEYKDPNLFNRMYNEPANYFDQEKTIKQAWDHLMEGGRLFVFRNKDYGKVLNNIGDDYEEVEDNVFQKKVSPKTPKKTVKLWL